MEGPRLTTFKQEVDIEEDAFKLIIECRPSLLANFIVERKNSYAEINNIVLLAHMHTDEVVTQVEQVRLASITSAHQRLESHGEVVEDGQQC